MRKLNLLKSYPNSNHPRIVSSNTRTIKHRIVASYRDKNFFDGDRNCGYGGFKYDGRWSKIVKDIFNKYSLKN